MNMILSESPKSCEFIQPPYLDPYDVQIEKSEPNIITKPLDDMEFTKNIILIYQYPQDNTLFVPSYISSGYQTHHAIYRLVDGELKLLFTRLHIIYDTLVYYYIDKDITNYLYNLGLNKNDIENVKNKKYKLNNRSIKTV